MKAPRWWSRAVSYQLYPRSFADSDGDGIGDLDGVTAHLDYLRSLGVDALWLNPVMVSPMVDHGYDVADPRDVDPLFGGMAALDRLIAAARAVDIKVTMDLVPHPTALTNYISVSISVWYEPISPRTPSVRRSRIPWPPPNLPTRHQPGRCPTTTSNAR